MCIRSSCYGTYELHFKETYQGATIYSLEALSLFFAPPTSFSLVDLVKFSYYSKAINEDDT